MSEDDITESIFTGDDDIIESMSENCIRESVFTGE